MDSSFIGPLLPAQPVVVVNDNASIVLTSIYYFLAIALPPLVILISLSMASKRRKLEAAALQQQQNHEWRQIFKVVLAPIGTTVSVAIVVAVLASFVRLYSDILFSGNERIQDGWYMVLQMWISLWYQFVNNFDLPFLPAFWVALVHYIRFEYVASMMAIDKAFLPSFSTLLAARAAVAAINIYIFWTIGLLLWRIVREWWSPRASTTP